MASVQLDVAFAHELPRMLHEPIYHIHHYIELLELLCKVAPESETGESAKLLQALSGLRTTKSIVDGLGVADDPNRGRPYLKFQHRASATSRRLQLCQRNIGDWRGPDLLSCATKVIRAGAIHVWSEKRKQVSERNVYVLDTIVLLCKPATDKRDTSQFRLKERLSIAGLVVESGAPLPAKLETEYDAALRIVPGADSDDVGPLLLLVHSDEAMRVWEAAICHTATYRVLEEAFLQREAEYERTLPLLIPQSDECVSMY